MRMPPRADKAALGDLVVIDFVGKIDGVEFDGGKGEGPRSSSVRVA